MTVKQLKKLLEKAPDDMMVLIPATGEFDGAFKSPCVEESGVREMGVEDLDEDEIKEAELLNKELKTEDSFIIVPCGFFEEPDHTHEMN